MNEGKVISQKKVYKAKLFEVREEELILPNGKKRLYSIVERQPVVVIFPLDHSLKLYLISQYRYLFKKKILEAVAGHMDKNEIPLEAAKRELKEETGITAFQWEEIARVESSASVIRSKLHLFIARDLEKGQASPSESEQIELVKLSINDAVKKVLIGEINNASTMIGILLLDKMRKEKTL